MSDRKPYRSIPVKRVDVSKVLAGHLQESVEVGLDVGKESIWAVCRFRDGTYERPWRASNPTEVGLLVEVLGRMHEGVKLTVAMESSGTYGDPLRHAMGRSGLEVRRVSSKASHDWSETFDGVPSQHDGKDAGVIAELCAMGRCVEWPLGRPDEPEQEMAYWVDRLETAHRRQHLWIGRLESRLARHWPEAWLDLKLTRAALLKALVKWSDPASMSADPEAAATLRRFSGRKLSEEAIGRLLERACRSVGVAMTEWDRRRMREDAEQALAARRSKSEATRRLRKLAAGHELLPALGDVVGAASACVLWVCVGDPRGYGSGAAYRKAMGLNLVERSSGKHQGQLRISKRGKGMPRRYLYFAAMRYVNREPVRRWYLRKKRRDGGWGKRGIVAVMRKLPLALYAAGRGEAFDADRLFESIVNEAETTSATSSTSTTSTTSRR